MKKVLVYSVLFFSISVSCVSVKDVDNHRLKKLISYSADTIKETGKNIVVAVVDSGINTEKTIFENRLLKGMNFVNKEEKVIDYDNHGTPVAAILLQFAPNITILPIAVAKGGTTSPALLREALAYAIEANVDIINISMGCTNEILMQVKDKVGELKFYQTLIVIAAGNFNEKREALLRAWPNILVVGATGLNAATSLCSYSGYGSGVDIAVPAGEVDDGLATVDFHSDAHRLFNGTSAAVPVVSAQAALLKEKYQGASANFIKETILNNSEKINTLNVAGGRL